MTRPRRTVLVLLYSNCVPGAKSGGWVERDGQTLVRCPHLLRIVVLGLVDPEVAGVGKEPAAHLRQLGDRDVLAVRHVGAVLGDRVVELELAFLHQLEDDRRRVHLGVAGDAPVVVDRRRGVLAELGGAERRRPVALVARPDQHGRAGNGVVLQELDDLRLQRLGDAMYIYWSRHLYVVAENRRLAGLSAMEPEPLDERAEFVAHLGVLGARHVVDFVGAEPAEPANLGQHGVVRILVADPPEVGDQRFRRLPVLGVESLEFLVGTVKPLTPGVLEHLGPERVRIALRGRCGRLGDYRGIVRRSRRRYRFRVRGSGLGDAAGLLPRDRRCVGARLVGPEPERRADPLAGRLAEPGVLQRRGDVVLDPVAEGINRAVAGAGLEVEPEFVTAEPGRLVARAAGIPLQDVGDRFQRTIAGLVAEGVVQRLEVVEVDPADEPPGLRAVTLPAAAVGEAREVVLQRVGRQIGSGDVRRDVLRLLDHAEQLRERILWIGERRERVRADRRRLRLNSAIGRRLAPGRAPSLVGRHALVQRRECLDIDRGGIGTPAALSAPGIVPLPAARSATTRSMSAGG